MSKVDLSPERPMTVEVLYDIKYALNIRDEVPPRLIYRACDWAAEHIVKLESKLDQIRHIAD